LKSTKSYFFEQFDIKWLALKSIKNLVFESNAMNVSFWKIPAK